jgi:hypothetical protein
MEKGNRTNTNDKQVSYIKYFHALSPVSLPANRNKQQVLLRCRIEEREQHLPLPPGWLFPGMF